MSHPEKLAAFVKEASGKPEAPATLPEAVAVVDPQAVSLGK